MYSDKKNHLKIDPEITVTIGNTIICRACVGQKLVEDRMNKAHNTQINQT